VLAEALRSGVLHGGHHDIDLAGIVFSIARLRCSSWFGFRTATRMFPGRMLVASMVNSGERPGETFSSS